MKKPKLILFDYGQTLAREWPFIPIEGNRAIIRAATANPHHTTPEALSALAHEMNIELERDHDNPHNNRPIEIHHFPFTHYLYEYFGLEFDLSEEELEMLFWASSAPNLTPTPHIDRLLDYLEQEGIPYGVISNISFSASSLRKRIARILPGRTFTFILATSEYVFRKPNPRIFELALRKAGLSASEVYYCGDNGYFDVDGAAGVGIFPVWYRGAIDYTHTEPTADCLAIDDWEELITHLANCT